MALTYEKIATTTLGSATSSITFSSIPQTYTHLQIRGIGRSSTANANITLRVNSDTSSSYTEHYLYGDGATVAAGGAVAGTFAYLGTNAPSGATASVFGTSIMDILDYTNTNKTKVVRMLWGSDQNGAGFVSLFSGSLNTTSAITAFNLFNGFNWASNSRFDLYGITTSSVTGA